MESHLKWHFRLANWEEGVMEVVNDFYKDLLNENMFLKIWEAKPNKSGKQNQTITVFKRLCNITTVKLVLLKAKFKKWQ